MKKLSLLLIAMVLLSCGNVYAGVDDDLIAQFQLDGGASDRFEKPNSATHLDTSQTIGLANIIHFFPEISISLWINTTSFTGTSRGDEHIISNDRGGWRDDLFLKWGHNNNKLEWSFQSQATQEMFQVTSIKPASDLANGTWFHVVGVFSSEGLMLYINAEFQGFTPCDVAVIAPGKDWHIGGNPTGSYRLSNTSVDDLRIYNRELTEAEIQLLFSGSLANTPPVAEAGPDVTGYARENTCVFGNGSTDEDGGDLTYIWSSETANTITTNDPSQACIKTEIPGEYVLELVAFDGTDYSEPDYVTVTITTHEDEAIASLNTAWVEIDQLPTSSFKNKNNGKTLQNKFDAAIGMIESGNIEEAYDKLVNDILKKNDGCSDAGAPDKNDWINNCIEQNIVSGLIKRAAGNLKTLVDESPYIYLGDFGHFKLYEVNGRVESLTTASLNTLKTFITDLFTPTFVNSAITAISEMAGWYPHITIELEEDNMTIAEGDSIKPAIFITSGNSFFTNPGVVNLLIHRFTGTYYNQGTFELTTNQVLPLEPNKLYALTIIESVIDHYKNEDESYMTFTGGDGSVTINQNGKYVFQLDLNGLFMDSLITGNKTVHVTIE